ncbi:MAG: sodium:solute symporter family protein [Gammaproteobacteria bacterium]|nr:sodium:solute symporter family protein [Gammaproteobacteria bacterium]MDH4253620.1 sodium:solute symporter family protein [Gammaproteobacteria bacterium]MDH5310383.1 sodium:solute symporter family protein [Gammaproteobacteria bacterium]
MIYTAVVGLYVLLLLAVAVYKSRTVRTDEDFMVAGRSVPVYLLVATLVCTWIGSGSLFGTAGLTFRTGISALWFSVGGWIGILAVYLVAARVRRIAQYTLTDLLEKRYSRLAKVLGTMTIIAAYMVIAGYQFKGGGRFISILSQGAISPESGMLIAAALIVGFTVLAGMVSIVSLDIFNGVVMLLGMLLALPFAVQAHGGVGAVIATIQQHEPSHLSIMGGHDFVWVVGIALPTFLLLMSESSVYQKFSSADSERNARRAVMGMFIGVILVELLMISIALIGYAIFVDDARFFLPDGSVNRAMAEEIILRIGFERLPVVVGSMLLAAGAAIIISTGNTFLMVTSTNVTRDIFQAYFYRNATPSQVVWLQRACIVGIGILAYLMMSQFETILEMALMAYTMIGASLAPPLLAAFFWKRVTRIAGVLSIASGMLTVIVIGVLNSVFRDGGTEILGLDFPMDTDYIAIPAAIVTVATLVLASLLTPRPADSDWQEFIGEGPNLPPRP